MDPTYSYTSSSDESDTDTDSDEIHHVNDNKKKVKQQILEDNKGRYTNKKHNNTMKKDNQKDSHGSKYDYKKNQEGDEKKQQPTISYNAVRLIGRGSFGRVFLATVVQTNEVVAIKKVLQDKRFKNRELAIMRKLDHPCVVTLKHCFYSKNEDTDEKYLHLAMEYIPETIHSILRRYSKAKKQIPLLLTKVYMYQIARSLAYIHSTGVCHRDIKPQNLLLNPETHIVKLCDFGSAKQLKEGEPNVPYICSRYYRAPELVFEASYYTTAIDTWSLGCVLAELLTGRPLFPGESGFAQMLEIMKIIGTPTVEEAKAMRAKKSKFIETNIEAHPWRKVFGDKIPEDAIDLISKLLIYNPNKRLKPFLVLCHPFFDEIKKKDCILPDNKPVPDIFNFTKEELQQAKEEDVDLL